MNISRIKSLALLFPEGARVLPPDRGWSCRSHPAQFLLSASIRNPTGHAYSLTQLPCRLHGHEPGGVRGQGVLLGARTV